MHRSAAMIGTMLCHFDRALFGLLIPFLAPLFFPHTDPIYALIYMYAIIPLGFFAKLMGALFFGRLGDRIGRGKTLSITLLGLAIKSGMIGFLPTYSQIGPLAPLILIFSRLALEFFSAGETTGGYLFLMEKTKGVQRNLISSFFDAAGILGIILASCAVWFMSPFPDFWRLLFWIGALVGLVGWWIRKLPNHIEEAPTKKQQTLKILWKERSAVFSIAAVAGFSYANYYLVTSFMNGFLPLISPLSKVEALSLNSLLLAIDLALLPIFGMLSLKIPKEKLMLFAIIALITSACPLFFLLQEATLFTAACVRITFTLFGTCLAAPYHAWVYENSPKEHRYLIGAVGSLIGSKLIGAPIPAISLWLYHQTASISAPALPLILIGVLALTPFLKRKQLEVVT